MVTKVKGINLLPNEYIVAEKISFYKKVIGALVAVEAVCFVFFVALPPKREVEDTARILQEKQLALKDPKYNGVNKTLNDLETAKSEMTKWIDQYNQIKVEDYIKQSLLDALVERLPEGVAIEGMEITAPVLDEATGQKQETIVLKGHSQFFEQAMNYLSVLETVYLPEEITHEISYEEDNKRYHYEMTITRTTIVNLPEEATEETGEGADTQEDTETEGEEDIVE